VNIFRGNRDFRACEAFRAAATAKEYVKATGAVWPKVTFFASNLREKLCLKGGASLKANVVELELETGTQDIPVLEKLAQMEQKYEEPGLTIDELDEE